MFLQAAMSSAPDELAIHSTADLQGKLLQCCSARQHVPLVEYVSNLNALIDRLQELGAQVLLITPPPVDEEKRIKLAAEVRPLCPVSLTICC